jgi:hypothetical protein
MSVGANSIAWAVSTLRRLEMPPEEIDAVVGADDPETVRRYLELHREQLEERLVEKRRTLARLERSLAQMVVDRQRRDATSRRSSPASARPTNA